LSPIVELRCWIVRVDIHTIPIDDDFIITVVLVFLGPNVHPVLVDFHFERFAILLDIDLDTILIDDDLVSFLIYILFDFGTCLALQLAVGVHFPREILEIASSQIPIVIEMKAPATVTGLVPKVQ
jgi:hypothetical protein